MKENNSNPYESIICHPHFVSKIFPLMPIEKRAAQFSPFKAMVGYEDEVAEEERFTESGRQLDESRMEELDWKIQMIMGRIDSGDKPYAAVTYFIPDEKKEGGTYAEEKGTVRKIDGVSKALIMDNGIIIDISRIIDIELCDSIL